MTEAMRSIQDENVAIAAVDPAAPHSISIPALGIVFPCDGRTSLLQSMILARHEGLAVGCRSGGCGVCRVRVIDGAFVAQRMSRQRISRDDEARGIVLACRIVPRSDMIVAPMPFASARPGACAGLARRTVEADSP